MNDNRPFRPDLPWPFRKVVEDLFPDPPREPRDDRERRRWEEARRRRTLLRRGALAAVLLSLAAFGIAFRYGVRLGSKAPFPEGSLGTLLLVLGVLGNLFSALGCALLALARRRSPAWAALALLGPPAIVLVLALGSRCGDCDTVAPGRAARCPDCLAPV